MLDDYCVMAGIREVKMEERLPRPGFVGESLFSCLSKFSIGSVMLCQVVKINKVIIILRILAVIVLAFPYFLLTEE